MNRNCYSCLHGGPRGTECSALDGSETEDLPILLWLQASDLKDDGTVADDADGCPEWRPRPESATLPQR